MFDGKTLALNGETAPVVFGETVPESARPALSEAVGRANEVRAKMGDFARRALLDMLRVTDSILTTVAATEGLSKDAAFTEVARNVPGLSKPALDKWGQSVARLRDAGLNDPAEWTPGAASASYALTASGYKEAKGALKGVEVESADAYVEAVADAINAHPRAEAKPPAVTVADVTGAEYTPEAFAQSVVDLLDAVPADKIDEARKQLRAIVNGYKREAVSA